MVHSIHQWLARIHHLFHPTTDRQQSRACAVCARTYTCFHQQHSHTRLAVLMRVCEFRESLTFFFSFHPVFSLSSCVFWGLCMENADMRFPASVFSCSKCYYFIQNVFFSLFLALCTSIIRFLEDGALCGHTAHMSKNLKGPVDYSLTLPSPPISWESLSIVKWFRLHCLIVDFCLFHPP